MSSGSIVLAAGIVLLGCIVLKGINPVDKAVEALIWTLYHIAALLTAVARTTDIAYLRLRRESRKCVSDISAQRATLHQEEELRMASVGVRTEAQTLKLVAN